MSHSRSHNSVYLCKLFGHSTVQCLFNVREWRFNFEVSARVRTGFRIRLHLICSRVKTRVRASAWIRGRALFYARFMVMGRVRAWLM